MKRVKTWAVYSSLVVGFVTVMSGLLPALLLAAPQEGSGGPSNGQQFINAKYQQDSVSPGNSSRFVFRNPFVIEDTQNPGTFYKTKSTACGFDKMFDCKEGQSSVLQGHVYWYWPTDDGGFPSTPTDGKCAAGITFDVRQSDKKARMYIEKPQLNARQDGCIVTNSSGNPIGRNDLEGWGDVSTISTGSQDYAKAIDLGVTADSVGAAATFLAWVSPQQLRAYSGRNIDLIPSNLDMHKRIVEAMGKRDATKKYQSGYSFYTTSNCTDQASGAVTALVAVQNSGGKSRVDILHQKTGNGQYDFEVNWHGDNQKCLAEAYTPSPNAYWGGSSSGVVIGVADVKNFSEAGSAEVVTGGTGGEAGENSCENEGLSKFLSLSWYVCGLIGVFDSAVGALDRAVMGLLRVNTGNVFADGLKEAWANIRNIALLLLVPIMLVMVIGTAINAGPFDAYTVKKALPRMLIAIIFISLSWEISRFFVLLSNAIGSGVQGIILSPFLAREGVSADQLTLPYIMGFGDSSAAVAAGGAYVFGAVAVGALSLGIALSMAITVAAALFIGFLLLAGREIIIAALVLIAPLAILAWIFPANTKFWSFWRTSFTGLLLLFPVIAALIAVGKAFALIIANQADPQAGGILNFFLKLVAYIGPYFLIPATFKLAGGTFATIAGIANDKSRGVFDRQKKKRQEAKAQGWQDFKTGSGKGRFRQSGLVTGAGKRVTGGFRGTFGKDAATVRDARWAAAGAAGAADFGKTAEAIAQSENDPIMQAVAVGKNFNESVANQMRIFGTSEEKAKENALIAQSTVDFGLKQQQWAAQQLVKTGTGYNGHDIKDKDGNVVGRVSGMDELAQTLAVASGGNSMAAASMAGYANAITKQVGRTDLAPGFTKLDNLVQGALKNGGQVDQVDLAEAQVLATQGVDAVTQVRGKPKQMTAVTNSIKSALESSNTIMSSSDAIISSNTATAEQKQAASVQKQKAAETAKVLMGQIRQLDNAKSYGSVENQQIINKLSDETSLAQEQALINMGAKPAAQDVASRRVTQWDTNDPATRAILSEVNRNGAPPPNVNNPNNQQP